MSLLRSIPQGLATAPPNRRLAAWTAWGPMVACALILTWALEAAPASAADHSKFDELTRIMDGAKANEVDVFAPKTWARAQENYQQAESLLKQSRKQQAVDKAVAGAREFADNAIKAAEVGKLSLQQYLDPRKRARSAKASSLVPDLYTLAETVFLQATAKVESGDVKGGLKKAAEAIPLYDHAEDAAIRVALLGAADKLIEKAVADDAVKYAPSTLDAARSARQRSADVLTKDRYNRTDTVREAHRAEYEARHASNIALSVRSLNRNDQAWEKLMLLYEVQMNRLGQQMGREYLPFDNGPIAATDSVLSYVQRLKSEGEQSKSEHASERAQLNQNLEQMRGNVRMPLQQTLARLGVTPGAAGGGGGGGGGPSGDDPTQLATQVDRNVAAMLAQKDTLAAQVKNLQLRLADLTTTQQQTSAELEVRRAKEDKLTKAKQTLNPSEGEILVDATGDVVLRLSGLSFDPGKADIKDQHVPLLQKVETILKLYPGASYLVEGHTDASGDGVANQQLSEKRAFAVMQYLRQGVAIGADRIKAIGYGSDRPIASNATPDGRQKNRRIDVLILQ